MSMINKQLEDSLKKLEQLERRKRLQTNRKKKAKEKNDERRNFIVGSIFLKFLPEFLDLQPQKTSEENEREFAPLINLLSALAADEDLVNLVRSDVEKITATRNIQNNNKSMHGS